MSIEGMPVRWIWDADIRGLFDHGDHEWEVKLVQYRVADRRILPVKKSIAAIRSRWLCRKVSQRFAGGSGCDTPRAANSATAAIVKELKPPEIPHCGHSAARSR